MPRACHPCPSCGEPVRGRCPQCQRAGDQARGTSRQRGYDTEHLTRFRPAVLRKDPICVCDQPHQHDHGERCDRKSRHADHYPLDRRDLVRQGLDPNDPQYGRGLCHRCHSAETARLQPGGFNRRI